MSLRLTQNVPLAPLTTLELGGPARWLTEVTDETELVAALEHAQSQGLPVFVLGGGSNVVFADAGFPGLVIRIVSRGVSFTESPTDRELMLVEAAAGEPWDALVAFTVARGLAGLECLSGIPGSVGATPIQNVGAYGQDVSQTISRVRTWDRVDRTQRTFAAADCGFGYRHSRFKAEPGRYVVLEVTFQLRQGDLAEPVEYAELARRLGVEVGQRVPLSQVREAVLALRAGKGMVLDAADHDTWSAGSFFTNPLLTPEQAAGLPDDAPRWEQPDGTLKSSAAWLIERAGFGKGHGLDRDGARVALSTKHTLALTNRGGAAADDLVALAREVRDGVEQRFGIRLVNEPVLVGLAL